MRRLRAANQKMNAVSKATDYCMRLLSYRQYSKGELEEKLRKRGYGERTIMMVINRLNELGLVDDEGLSKGLVQSAIERQNRGRHAVIAEMRRLKLPEDCIQSAIEMFDLETEINIAVKLMRKWLSDEHCKYVSASLCDSGENQKVRQLILRLLRRGFSHEAIMGALRRIGCKPPVYSDADEVFPLQSAIENT
ncbi:MAG: RecX family transcriptional regulator [Armatimonadota bacterium]|nr:RecX family transcriptional regulator [Armatimonadota bacterium]MCX7776482.1 RecX family transcriptional regulator [Armatimonadota bacterium]MDW8024279.1 RecX family transcriptional regulator [Armatimonadota bacterium]